MARCRDGVLTRSPQRSKYPVVQARLLFLVLFLFRKKGREKEQKLTILINLNWDSILLGLRPKPCSENFFGKKFSKDFQKALYKQSQNMISVSQFNMLSQMHSIYNKHFVNIILKNGWENYTPRRFSPVLSHALRKLKKIKKMYWQKRSFVLWLLGVQVTAVSECSSVVECQPSKLIMWVRFPSLAF